VSFLIKPIIQSLKHYKIEKLHNMLLICTVILLQPFYKSNAVPVHAMKTYRVQQQKFLAMVLMQINRQLQATATLHTHTHTHKVSLLTTKQEAMKSVQVVQRREKYLAPASKQNAILNFPAHSKVTITAKLSQFVFRWESCRS
jgi:hypothetical protein